MRTQDDTMDEADQSGPPTDHDIVLQTITQGKKIDVRLKSGNPAPSLPPNSGAHRLRFQLEDNSGANVRFRSLDREDGTASCPPASGNNSQQVVAVQIDNNPAPARLRSAAFTDNNSNPSKNGTLSVCYQWNFDCDDPNATVTPFDPVITNGGKG